ncbi:MAG: undecaprenyl/decaprenyl-phosphate alpha-N-acetylglucosaminyl 1-phosphate transferase [Clostridiales bacterium]|nr:undecaprenyl/decaprenyl-phosphate alpha-N-acetylglucosaminyl 1-phosphate transferase [Clostridiales bacterium]MCF8022917.1 undecaprenyl/decaprenyl-phosphate alpha-N-acetylglucosaminyl 1-phosphate transferase [Clostridiales bacterium]
MAKVLATLFTAFILSWIFTPWVKKKAFSWGAVDKPAARKVHKSAMPRIGGLAVYMAFVPVVLLSGGLTMPVYGMLLGGTLVMALGVVDDIRGLPARVKLVGQVAAASAVIPFGIKVQYITNPLSGDLFFLGWLAVPVTVFWIVSVINAINLIDGLDGLAGGVSCIAALTLAAVAWTQGHMFNTPGMAGVILLALAFAAAILGFLRHNFHPASIFLGDSGSMFLGFTLAVMSIMSFTKSATAISVIIPLVILGLPLMDTFFAIIRRYYKQQPIFQPDKEHLHHRLMAIGFSHRQAVLVIYGLSVVLGISAVFLNVVSTDQAAVLLIILAVIAIVTANKVGYLGKKKAVVPTENKKNTRSAGM